MVLQDTWTIPVERRTFVEIVDLPYWARKLVSDPAQKPKGLNRFRRKISKSMYALLYDHIGLRGAGRMVVGKDRVEVPINGGYSVYVDFASRSRYGGYEPVESALLDRLLVKASVFYDIGSNWGYYSLLAGTNDQFNGQIFAFDVVNNMSDELENIARAADLDRVHVKRFGLSDRNGLISISRERHAHLTKVLDGKDPRGMGASVRRLDDLDIPPPDLIKMDVEDHELSVFLGGQALIKNHLPAVLFESRAGKDGRRQEPLAFLSENRYALFRIDFGNCAQTEITVRRNDPHSDYWSSNEAVNILALPENGVEWWLS